jgi:hypothetical protein
MGRCPQERQALGPPVRAWPVRAWPVRVSPVRAWPVRAWPGPVRPRPQPLLVLATVRASSVPLRESLARPE